MANRLEKALEPGEKVFYRPRMNCLTALKFCLNSVLVIALCWYVLVWLLDFGRLLDLDEVGWLALDPSLVFCFAAALSVYYLLLGRLITYRSLRLTDRRILWRRGLFSRNITSIPLSDVRSVHGLEKNNRLPRQVEMVGGNCEFFMHNSFIEEFYLSVAKAAGLSLPTEPCSPPERIAGQLYKAYQWGFSVIFIGLLPGLFLFKHFELLHGQEPLHVIAFAVLTMIMILVGPCLSAIAGHIGGPVLVIVFQRRAVTAEEMREALSILVHRGFLLNAEDVFCRFHRLIFRFASWIYGEPIPCKLKSGV